MSKTASRRSTSARGGCQRQSRSRSRAHRWRTTSWSCGRCYRSRPQVCFRTRPLSATSTPDRSRRKATPNSSPSCRGGLGPWSSGAPMGWLLSIFLLGKNRPAVIQRCKDGDAPVFLISLKAGGFGLNLAEADYCFLLDPWWNPATEAQAVDRIHRIGQTRKVMVYRLVARDTIEDKVMALKARKAKLFSSVMDQGDIFSTALDAEDIRRLLG